jgi:hypothetical protein
MKKRTIQKNWQHRVHTKKKSNSKHNIICIGHHYAQANTNNVNKKCTFLQATGGKHEPNIVFKQNS